MHVLYIHAYTRYIYVQTRIHRFDCPSWPRSHEVGDGCSGIDVAPDLPGLPGVTIQFIVSCTADEPPEGCGKATTFPGIILRGPYAEVLQAVRNVTYIPADDQNSVRLRSRIYSGSSSRSVQWPVAKPYEELTVSVKFFCAGCGYAAQQDLSLVRRYMLHILPMNDKPVLVNPEDTYTRPRYCEPTPEEEDCVHDGAPLSTENCHRCHFGPFWAYEGRSAEVVQATGLEVTDTDIIEDCAYTDQKCTSLDVTALTLNGIFELNTLLGLNTYRNQPASKGFTAPINAVVSAVTVLNYQAPATIYNTQHSGQTEEIQVVASDQGFKGATGRATESLVYGTSLSATARIRINIVAVNDAPTIHFDVPGGAVGGVLRYNVKEDELQDIVGVRVEDDDVEEDVVSTLASALWMNDQELQPYIKKIKTMVEVSKGILFFPILNDLTILATFEAFYITIEPRYRKHDLCRSRAIITAPVGETGRASYAAVCAKVLGGGCVTGDEAACANADCLSVDPFGCDTGRILLHLRPADRLPQAGVYYQALLYAIATMADRTCGGVPYYESPHSFSTGFDCENDKACQQEAMAPCTERAGGCRCCANLNVSCGAHADCANLEAGSLCGCTYGGLAAREERVRAETAGQCGPWLPAEAKAKADTDGDDSVTIAELVAFRTACRATPDDIACEMYETSTRPLDCLTCTGLPCTYVGEGSQRCLHPLKLGNGTLDPTVSR